MNIKKVFKNTRMTTIFLLVVLFIIFLSIKLISSLGGLELTDHSIINTTELCEAYNLGMKVDVYPCIATTLSGENINQRVDFHWEGSQPQQTSWIFIYDSQLESGMILVGINESYQKKVINYIEKYVSDYSVTDVINYTDMSPPTIEDCELGTENNSMMYKTTFGNSSGYWSINYCFSEYEVINSTAFRISGNATVREVNYVQDYHVVFDGTTVPIEYLGNDLLGEGLYYYKVNDVLFNPGQTYHTNWIFTPKDRVGEGKWHIFGYNSDITIQDAISSGQYIYVDPGWDNTLTDKLLAYWNATDTGGTNLEDVFTSAYNATMTNTVYTNSTNGLIGSAANFSGSGSSALMDNVGTGNVYAVSMWINPGVSYSDGSTTVGLFITKRDDWYGARLGDATGSCSNEVVAISSNNAGARNCWQDAAFVFDAGTWYHVVINWNGTDYEIWVDNDEKQPNIRVGTPALLPFDDVLFGAIRSLTYNYKGVIDEIAYFNASLNSSDISALYNSGSGITYVPTPAPPVVSTDYLQMWRNLTSGLNVSWVTKEGTWFVRQIGIGVTNPLSELDINGSMLLVPTTDATCIEGKVFYNDTAKGHYGCNGTAWYAFY